MEVGDPYAKGPGAVVHGVDIVSFPGRWIQIPEEDERAFLEALRQHIMDVGDRFVIGKTKARWRTDHWEFEDPK